MNVRIPGTYNGLDVELEVREATATSPASWWLVINGEYDSPIPTPVAARSATNRKDFVRENRTLINALTSKIKGTMTAVTGDNISDVDLLEVEQMLPLIRQALREESVAPLPYVSPTGE